MDVQEFRDTLLLVLARVHDGESSARVESAINDLRAHDEQLRNQLAAEKKRADELLADLKEERAASDDAVKAITQERDELVALVAEKDRQCEGKARLASELAAKLTNEKVRAEAWRKAAGENNNERLAEIAALKEQLATPWSCPRCGRSDLCVEHAAEHSRTCSSLTDREAELQQQIEELNEKLAVYESHGPEGRNATNADVVELREKLAASEATLNATLESRDDADDFARQQKERAEKAEAALSEARALLVKLVFAGRTTGGVAGPDAYLMQHLSAAEDFLARTAPYAGSEQQKRDRESLAAANARLNKSEELRERLTEKYAPAKDEPTKCATFTATSDERETVLASIQAKQEARAAVVWSEDEAKTYPAKQEPAQDVNEPTPGPGGTDTSNTSPKERDKAAHVPSVGVVCELAQPYAGSDQQKRDQESVAEANARLDKSEELRERMADKHGLSAPAQPVSEPAKDDAKQKAESCLKSGSPWPSGLLATRQAKQEPIVIDYAKKQRDYQAFLLATKQESAPKEHGWFCKCGCTKEPAPLAPAILNVLGRGGSTFLPAPKWCKTCVGAGRAWLRTSDGRLRPCLTPKACSLDDDPYVCPKCPDCNGTGRAKESTPAPIDRPDLAGIVKLCGQCDTVHDLSSCQISYERRQHDIAAHAAKTAPKVCETCGGKRWVPAYEGASTGLPCRDCGAGEALKVCETSPGSSPSSPTIDPAYAGAQAEVAKAETVSVSRERFENAQGLCDTECDVSKDRTWVGQYLCGVHGVCYRDNSETMLCPVGKLAMQVGSELTLARLHAEAAASEATDG